MNRKPFTSLTITFGIMQALERPFIPFHYHNQIARSLPCVHFVCSFFVFMFLPLSLSFISKILYQKIELLFLELKLQKKTSEKKRTSKLRGDAESSRLRAYYVYVSVWLCVNANQSAIVKQRSNIY